MLIIFTQPGFTIRLENQTKLQPKARKEKPESSSMGQTKVRLQCPAPMSTPDFWLYTCQQVSMFGFWNHHLFTFIHIYSSNFDHTDSPTSSSKHCPNYVGRVENDNTNDKLEKMGYLYQHLLMIGAVWSNNLLFVDGWMDLPYKLWPAKIKTSFMIEYNRHPTFSLFLGKTIPCNISAVLTRYAIYDFL